MTISTVARIWRSRTLAFIALTAVVTLFSATPADAFVQSASITTGDPPIFSGRFTVMGGVDPEAGSVFAVVHFKRDCIALNGKAVPGRRVSGSARFLVATYSGFGPGSETSSDVGPLLIDDRWSFSPSVRECPGVSEPQFVFSNPRLVLRPA
jgi:hypothetical protein